MAFDIGDIEDENFKNVSADVRAIFEPFINCDCDSHGKSKSHTPHFSGQANGLKRGHDEDSEAWDASFSETNPEDPVDAEDFFDLESALAQARAQILAQKQAKNKSSYKKPTRDENFESFVSKADERIESLLNLRPEKYVCSGCQEHADIFCKACVQFFCKHCHRKCNGKNHIVKNFCPELDATDRLLRFKNTFQQYSQCVSINTEHTLCSCEGECKKDSSITFRRKDSHVTILHSDFTLTTGDVSWCTAYCKDPFVALWAYGYLQITDNAIISLEACQFLADMAGSSFKSFEGSIKRRNEGTNLHFKSEWLTLSKYCWIQMMIRLQKREGCVCCIDPVSGENRTTCILSDYSCLIRDKKNSSCKRQPGVISRLVADEPEFQQEVKIFEEACELGGSKSKPQFAQDGSPSDVKEETKCKDKFQNPHDQTGSNADVRKILLHACSHGWILLVALSRALGERAQYILATLALLIATQNLVVEKFSFDCACKLVKVAISALEHVSPAIREAWLLTFVETLTFGPFHGPNHGIKCYLDTFCKGVRAELFGDSIESIFKKVKLNLHTLRKLCFSFFITELDWRFQNWNADKLVDMPITHMRYESINNAKIALLQKEIAALCLKLEIPFKGRTLDEVLDEILSWDKESLIERRQEVKELDFVEALLKHRFLETRIEQQNGQKSHLCLKFLPSVAMWEHHCDNGKDLKVQRTVIQARLKHLAKTIDPKFAAVKKFKRMPNLLAREDINELLGFYLFQKLKEVEAELFDLVRTEAMVKHEYCKHQQRGDNYMRSQVWEKGRERRSRISELTSRYQSLRAHIVTQKWKADHEIDIVGTIKDHAKDIEYVWEEDLTPWSGKRISLYVKSFKLRSRFILQDEVKMWQRRWCANTLIILRESLEKIADGDGELLMWQLRAQKYYQANLNFKRSNLAKQSSRAPLYLMFCNTLSAILSDCKSLSRDDISMRFGFQETVEPESVKKDTDSDPIFWGKDSTAESAKSGATTSSKKAKINPEVQQASKHVVYQLDVCELEARDKNRLNSIVADANVQSDSNGSKEMVRTVEKPEPSMQFSSLIEFLVVYRKRLQWRPPQLVEMENRLLDARQDNSSEDVISLITDEVTKLRSDHMSSVRLWGITSHPLLVNKPLDFFKQQNLAKHDISAIEIHRLLNHAQYGDDKHSNYMEYLLRNHDFGYEVKVITSNYLVGTEAFRNELPEPIAENEVGIVLTHVGESDHYSVAVRTNQETAIQYANTGAAADITLPSSAELRQYHFYFSGRNEDDSFNLFAHNCDKQQAVECLFVSFLNGFLLLKGFDLARIKVRHEVLREWAFHCFQLERILDPFQFKGLCKKTRSTKRKGQMCIASATMDI